MKSLGAVRALTTAGRMPATLAVCRALKRQGAHVIGTDALPFTPLTVSNCVNSYFQTASPALEPEAFINDLIRICIENKVSHIIPMYEEGFVVSKNLEKLRQAIPEITIQVSQQKDLALLDDKFRFIDYCEKLDLLVPKTIQISTDEELHAAMETIGSEIVLKPVFSRFASNVYLRPSAEEIATIKPSIENPWVAQELIEGDVISSYGICQDGVVKVHADYNNEFVTGAKSSQGLGASSSFQPRESQQTREFANKLFESIRYTGQYGLDFILGPKGAACIECNPRSTSGVHLFEKQQSFSKILAGLNTTEEPNPSGASNHLQLLRSMLSGETKLANPRLIKALLCRDVIFDFRDTKPLKGFQTMLKQVGETAAEQQRPAADVFFEDLACEPR
jgi:carbamoylphosphate synthase large subunit